MVKEFYSKSSRDVDSRWAEDALMKDEVCRPFYTFSERQMNQMPQNCGKLAICRFSVANALSHFPFTFSRQYPNAAKLRQTGRLPFFSGKCSPLFFLLLSLGNYGKWSIFSALRQMFNLPRFYYAKYAVCRFCRLLYKITTLIMVFI